MVTILHISDLHFTVSAHWNNMREALLEKVEQDFQSIPDGQKLLVITGDLHNFSSGSYEDAAEFLPELFDRMGIDPAEDVFVIPGNHDAVDDAVVREAYVDSLQGDINKMGKYHDGLLGSFRSYMQLVRDVGIYGEDAGDLPGRVHVRTWRDKLHILHLNTALAADGKQKDNQLVDIDTATSRAIREQSRQGSLPILVIGHNDFYDLHKEHQKSLKGMFRQEKVSGYLCGDKHRLSTEGEQQRIFLDLNDTSNSIPNIVGYKGTGDNKDTYSDFGMIYHKWDEESNQVTVEYWEWDPEFEQAEFHQDTRRRNTYEMKYKAITASAKPEASGSKAVAGKPETSGSRAVAGKSEASGSKAPALVKTGSDKSGTSPVLEKIPAGWMLVDQKREQQKHKVNAKKIAGYLRGKKCTWSIAFSDRIVHRKIADEMFEHAADGGIMALLGAGGEGKSTALMQMCVKLYQEGYTVLYHVEGEGFEVLPKVEDRVVFVIDNVPNSREFREFIIKAQQEEWTVVLGCRYNEWNLLKNSQNLTFRDVEVYEMPQVKSSEEAGQLADCVIRYLEPDKGKEEITEVFLNNSYGFLYAAMLMLIYGQNSLEEIGYEIISKLAKNQPAAMKLLASIVLSEHMGIPFSQKQYREVCRELGIAPRTAKDALELEVKKSGFQYETRHASISEVFYHALFSEKGMLLVDEKDELWLKNMQYHLQEYVNAAYIQEKRQAEEKIEICLEYLDEVSEKAQSYVLDRLIEELRRNGSFLANLQSKLKSRENREYLLRKCYEREIFDSTLLYAIAKFQIENGNIGTYEENYCARKVYREACLKYNGDSSVWVAWGKLEEASGNIGSYEEENSARWIYRKGCLNYQGNSNVWTAWGKLEEANGNIGSCEEENTVRWIYRQSCLNYQGDSGVWMAWGKLEEGMGNIGSYEEENSARWIYREGCLNYHGDSNVWASWGRMEESNGNVGSYEEENSARWIYREGCLNYHGDSNGWMAWGKLEESMGNIGSCEEENSARWIYRKGCLNCQEDSNVWINWGRMEESVGNIGSCEEENSARWIYATGSKKFREAAVLYARYASLELRCCQVEKARQILRESLRENEYNINALAVLEILCGNIDTEDDPYAAVQLMKRMEASLEVTTAALGLSNCHRLLGNMEEAERYKKIWLAREDCNPRKDGSHFITLCQQAIAGQTE